MIGLLRGKLLVKKPPELLLDVSGVGYELQASLNTFYQLPQVGEEVTLLTQLIVRETAQLLFGFYTELERAIFRELIKVSGVGPKLAIAILSGIDTKSLLHCIRERDSSRLVKLPGVGSKTAERLVVELQGKIAKYFAETEQFSSAVISSAGESGATEQDKTSLALEAEVIGDAVSALLALGYKEQEARRIIAKVADNKVAAEVADVETLIRLALQAMSK